MGTGLVLIFGLTPSKTALFHFLTLKDSAVGRFKGKKIS
jgi:hypothetical protein